MSRNGEVAALLEEYAALLEAQDVDFKPRAYRKAAQNIEDHPEPIEALAAEGLDAVTAIDGVGDGIGEKVIEYIETGEIAELEEERDRLPVDMETLTRVEGVGPKTAAALYEALGITTLDELETAARNGEVREVSGFGETTEANILEHVEFARQSQERQLLGDARPVADDVLAHLEEVDVVERCEVAGSIRRWRETIGDVDVLVGSDAGESVADAMADWDRVDSVIETGPTKTSVRIADMRVDLRVVTPTEFGSALQYFTGSKDHNITLRNHAIEKGLKINEYGIFDVSDVADPDAGQRVGELLASETEEAVYEAVDLPWIAPEMREDRGEIDAALAGELPDLIDHDDVRGDLHTHTDWSDGEFTVEEMLEGAAEFGHDYLCISDHAAGPGVFGDSGLTDEEVADQLEVVHEAGESVDIEVFTGIEANIAADGTVGDLDDETLAELDLVIASPHSGLTAEDDQTERLIAAIEHPAVDVLGHPSGRLLNQRPGIEFDPARLGAAAAEHDVALEINSNPHRLDLWGSAVQTAIDAGATIVIDTDAHSPQEFGNLRYGIHTARRGWASPPDVLNTRDADGVREFLH
ncbi:DNA polymerase IV (family X) [Halanaeroarchaeum sp. HSR-CO]|uniref:DNA polymerase/3'-5' exonuclease PolX n=1 Tax=Halanaeroarchaeum sp. HSR-CO TaxID=2866382 RepID=UPI00217D51BE|nr:DNA polymerase/3'-5' exonuclease PolX [Halanaeroarchaeum sp. HSR-CO]UWG47298.1 DNA polymerase IV (family X) [Halanaeroarchaeum sp. HSR-CO]